MEYLYCPCVKGGEECKNKLCKIPEKKFQTNINIKCDKCKKLISWNCETKEITIKRVPLPNTSSGRFVY